MWPIEVSLDRPIGREMEMWAEGKVRCGLRGWGRALRQAWPRKVPPGSLLEEPEVAWGEGPGTCFPFLEVVCPSQRVDFRKRVGMKFWINMGWTFLHVKVVIIGMVCHVKLWDLFILRFQSRWMISLVGGCFRWVAHLGGEFDGFRSSAQCKLSAATMENSIKVP